MFDYWRWEVFIPVLATAPFFVASLPYALGCAAVMLIGERARLHKGSVCYLYAGKGVKPGQPKTATVVAFDKKRKKWAVDVEEREKRYVPESDLRFGHSVIPDAIPRFRNYAPLGRDESSSCGRGLVATKPIKAGTLLFEEPPFMIVSAWGDESDPNIANRHQAERWLAYKRLYEGAARDGNEALKAFEELTCDATVPDDVDEGARYAHEKYGHIAGKKVTINRIRDVLMRFKCNQFGFEEKGNPAFAGAALYARTSLMNHSCRPSAVVATKEIVCAANQMPFDFSRDGGVRVCISARDLAPGDPITFSYHTPCCSEEMGVEERREILLRKYGFVCRCERCVIEAPAAAAAEEEQPKAAAATEEPAMAAAKEILKEVMREPSVKVVTFFDSDGRVIRDGWHLAAVGLTLAVMAVGVAAVVRGRRT